MIGHLKSLSSRKGFCYDLSLNFLLGLLVFIVLTSGAFLIDREFYELLSANKFLHILSLNFCTLLAAALCWSRYRSGPESFSGILPVRLFLSFLNSSPKFSLSILYGLYFLTQFMTLCLMHAGLQTALWDFGFNDSIVWNTAHGNFLTVPVRGGQNALGEHFTPIFILLAPVYWISNSANALFLVQTLTVAACVPLTYGIARKLNVSHASAFLLAVSVFFYLPLRSGILFPFQAQTFADPFLLLGFYFLLCSRDLLGLTSLLFALMCKENIVMEVLGVGLFAIAKNRRVGWLVAGLAVLVFALNTKIIEPAFQFDYRWNKWGYYSHITQPSLEGWTRWVQSFFSLKTFSFLFLVFAPVLFLPFRAKGWFWLLGPTLAVRLITPFTGFRIITAHYTAGLNALLFIASAYGLARVREGIAGRLLEKIRVFLRFPSLDSFLRSSLLVSALLFAGIPQFFRLENDLWEASSDQNQRIVKILESIPASYSVVSTETLLAHLTHRPYIFAYDSVTKGSPLEAVAARADLLVVDEMRSQPNDRRSLENYLQRGYQQVFETAFMKIYARPDLASQFPQELLTQWKSFASAPEIPYRKRVRYGYKRFLIVVALLETLIYWLRMRKLRAASPVGGKA